MKTHFRVRKYKHERLKWVVRGKVGDKWQRKFFETGKEAKEYAHVRNTELFSQGHDAITFPAELRIMALEADALLRPYGKTIRDAALHYAERLKEQNASMKVDAVLQEWHDAKAREGRSKYWLAQIRQRGGGFARMFPGKLMADFTTRDCADYIDSRKLTNPYSLNCFRMLLVGLFSFAKQRGYCTGNPAYALPVAKCVDEPPGIVSSEQMRKVLEHVPSDLLAYVTLGAFAGLRRSEICRLTWDEIDLERCQIDIAAKKTKSSRRRLVKIEPVLKAWLELVPERKGKVAPTVVNFRYATFRKAMRKIVPLPKNAWRHSYASHHLAHFQDAPRLALEMGHTGPALIFAHYRAVVTPEDAAQYWQLFPNLRSEKIVPFSETFALQAEGKAKVKFPCVVQVWKMPPYCCRALWHEDGKAKTSAFRDWDSARQFAEAKNAELGLSEAATA